MKYIGETLRNKREQLGMTLVELEKKTKIQRPFLVMIEKNEFEKLPNPDYARGFITKYASAINVSPAELIDKHQSELPKTTPSAKEAFRLLTQEKRSQTEISENKMVAKLITQMVTFFGVCLIAWVLLIIII
ncbi:MULTISPECIES: helix-turn-helix domain-containing protein [Mammaliicoccus]|uniref:Helix-turn-helix domain-containing protein n=1 Tax=Mammaliicoccus fleurettii TaxID=150056 RepID=A0ABS5MJ43_9STAP|nr:MULTISPECIES: helix-turn-helix domain-containing protein [Mammaliicoccus]HCN59594.1 helix-turn-helix domain-containing protein [Staphylococcus sp.]MBL0846848.1 helix-turn-helix domain-containing protein [Mammaliicoccus fleurettii]MBS3670810.1 helix-turn-helix domain-containing protein [Mammaliicoccus fleurettii]MBS3695869.1 helix-turn-helix domain-containing protein [Mammaliicoccus fleurettii]MBW0764575.1 helix-turn-helix domain-containing protein [Mammaliicoccus fleurettii]